MHTTREVIVPVIVFSSSDVWWTVLEIFRVDWCVSVLFYCRDWTYSYYLCAYRNRQAAGMDTPGFASPIRVFRENLCHMRKSNDVSDTEQTLLDSLGVLDLDLSLGPDAFGLKAFDAEMGNTRMLPGSGPCDLRLLLPDVGLGEMGFHDVVIENLLGTSVWRSKHVTPADVIGLRQRWPKAVFQVMRERSVELEDMRRKAFTSGQPAYRYTGRGYCPVCKAQSDNGLDTHMMCHHLALGQLWRCPVEWCAVWKGSVRECRDHFNDKHSGSETIDFDHVSKAFPAWTVPRDFWNKALRPEISGIAVDVMLFHESGRKLVHKYRVYRDPLPHPALREGKISKLILLATRAMVVAQLTTLRIAIPASGHAPGEVPLDCFPEIKDVTIKTDTRRVSFTAVDNTIGDLSESSSAELVEKPSVIIEVTEPHTGSPVPPPGFRPFEWPQAHWNTNDDLQRDPGLKFVTSWSAKLAEEEMSSPPPLEPISPTPMMDSRDSMTVHVGTPEAETVTPVVVDQIRTIHRRRARKPSSPRTNGGNSTSGADFRFKDILCTEALIRKRPGSVKSNNSVNYPVPRWRLAREGPFPNERSQASLKVLGKGCLFRHTTYEWEDHTRPKSGLGVPLNHPRFLEWLGTPDTAWLLEMSPGHWCDTLSRDRALTAAMQLHKDACLMQTNLDILDQYALALHGTASTILQRTIGGASFPSTEVLTGAPGAHARRVSVQMEALGLWRPTLDPLQFAATRS